MVNDILKPDKREIFFLSSISAFVASLCCFAPLILFLLGLSTASFASSLADVFYGQYKWFFRFAGIFFLLVAFIFYLRKKGICTLDQAKKQRNKIINLFLILVITAMILYVIWLYVIIEYIGVISGLWKGYF
ncbi:hypothetical protein HYV79_00290 [Candidatus Woesearchaeota archaeon]|nr:hypothetical protein [Candidatus Woesearchaeota archaeon]